MLEVPKKPDLTIRGFAVFKNEIDPAEQSQIVDCVRDVVSAAPLFSPQTPFGKPMSVRMTSAGRVGWCADKSGYRYAERHPNGALWPPIPDPILEIWRRVSGIERDPDCCLINFYGQGAHMGMHQDKDEADFRWPVLSISLGDDALFRVGNITRGGGTESIWLGSGDVVVMGGNARLAYHGIDRTRFASSSLLPKGGRINLTLRIAG
jgi:alkylated DNA repair protein (DNA oxidative demethylase)